MKRSHAAGEAAIVLLAWAAAIALVHPRGEFPIHDDWDFSIATFNFARTGHFHFTPFTAVSLRAQVLWGALWTHLFGESFEVLRASTLALSACAVFVVHRTLLGLDVPRFGRLAGTMALIVHPIFLWASCTFMTDVPFVFSASVALYCFFRALREDSAPFMIAGCAATVIAWFVRQNGVMLLIPPLLLIAGSKRRWHLAVPVVTTLALFIVISVAKPEWLAGSPHMFALHYQMLGESTFRTPEKIAIVYHYFAFNALNCGVFFLPLSLPLVARPMNHNVRIAFVIVALLLLIRIVILGASGYWMPYNSRAQFSDILPGPIVSDFAIGPPNLTDVFSMGYRYPFALITAAKVILTFSAALLGAWLIVALAAAPPLAALTVAVCTAVLCLSGYYYDRYSLDSAWALAIAIPFVIPWERLSARILSAAALVAIGLFSTMGVQEFFAWNRARWSMYGDLRARGVAIEQIDGGVEAWSYYELAGADRRKAARGHPPRRYMIAFHRVPGYHIIASRPFAGFFGLRRGTVYTLQQD